MQYSYRTRSPWLVLPASVPARAPLPCSGPDITAATASRCYYHHHIPGPPLILRGAPPVAGPAPPSWPCRSLPHGCAVLFCGRLPRKHRGGGPGLEREKEKEEGALLLPVPGLLPAHATGPATGPVVPRLRTQLSPLPMRSTKCDPPAVLTVAMCPLRCGGRQ